MRNIDGWTPLVDVLAAAGYARGAVGVTIAEVRTITSVTQRQMKSGGRPAYCVPASDAVAVADLLRERRALNGSPERKRAAMAAARLVRAAERLKPKPEPKPKPKPGAAPPVYRPRETASLEQELEGLTRRLKMILPKLGIDEYAVTRKESGELKCEISQVKVIIKEIK